MRSRTIEEQSATKLRIQRLDQKAKGLETKVEELRKQVFVLGERRGVLSRRWSEAKKKAGLFVPGTTAHEVLGQETLLQLHQVFFYCLF